MTLVSPFPQRFLGIFLTHQFFLIGLILAFAGPVVADAPDIGVTEIVSPSTSVSGTLCELSAVPVQVRVKNFGTSAIASDQFSVKIQLNGQPVPVNTASNAVTIMPGQDAVLSFTGRLGYDLDLANVNAFTFTAETIVFGDTFIANNALTIEGTTTTVPFPISSAVVSTIPYTESFESGFGDWTNIPGCFGSSSFGVGDPSAKPDLLKFPAPGGASSIVTDISQFAYFSNARDIVISPTFDLTSFQFLELNLSINNETRPPYLNVGGDGATLQTSSDGGATWDDVGTAGEPYNWFNNGSITTLQPAAGTKAGWSGYDTAGSGTNRIFYSYRSSGPFPYTIAGSDLLGTGGWITAKHIVKGGDNKLFRVLFASRSNVGSPVLIGDEGFAFDDFTLLEGPAAPMIVGLVNDVDGDGRADPGDRLRYFLVIDNPTALDLRNAYYTDTLADSGIGLVSGSVTTTRGTVTTGNTNGDTSVSIDLGTSPATGAIVITYDVIVQALTTGTLKVCTQGTVHSDVFLPAALLTDDPFLSGIADQTCQSAFIDTDNDGTPDDVDLCPGHPETPDADGDGVADACDVCPGENDLLDTDSDGAPNSCDVCPSDSAKTTSAGSCGCGFPETDGNGNGVSDCIDPAMNTALDGSCLPGSTDCAVQPLGSTACAVVNTFLGQTNILAIANLKSTPLGFTTTLIDGGGVEKGGFSGSIPALKKQDFNVNVLGLEPNSVNTVCVSTNATTLGAWSGSVAIYKPNNHNGVSSPIFGATGFDYVLHHPLQNPFRGLGAVGVPLNTFHFGIDPAAQTANYVSLADAARGDGQRLKGMMHYFGMNGQPMGADPVDIPDGGRQDFNGHLALNPPTGNGDAVGSAVFVPVQSGPNPPQFLMSETRYLADCTSPGCTDYATAFVINPRPVTANLTAETVARMNGETAIVEALNLAVTPAEGTLGVRGEFGEALGEASLPVVARGVSHKIMDKVTVNNTTTGFVEDGQVASAQLTMTTGQLAAQTIFYKLNTLGQLQYAYAVPFLGGGGTSLSAYYNTFIQHKDSSVIVNTSPDAVGVNVDYVDFNGSTVFNENFEVGPNGIRQVNPAPPADSYGAMNVTTTANGIVVNNIIRRGDEYAICSSGR